MGAFLSLKYLRKRVLRRTEKGRHLHRPLRSGACCRRRDCKVRTRCVHVPIRRVPKYRTGNKRQRSGRASHRKNRHYPLPRRLHSRVSHGRSSRQICINMPEEENPLTNRAGRMFERHNVRLILGRPGTYGSRSRSRWPSIAAGLSRNIPSLPRHLTLTQVLDTFMRRPSHCRYRRNRTHQRVIRNGRPLIARHLTGQLRSNLSKRDPSVCRYMRSERALHPNFQHDLFDSYAKSGTLSGDPTTCSRNRSESGTMLGVTLRRSHGNDHHTMFGGSNKLGPDEMGYRS